MTNAPRAPLILTLQLNAGSQAFFNASRQRYFPPERNVLDAHLTLFHQLPDTPKTFRLLESVKENQFVLDVTGLLFLGAGVAYRIESKRLHTLHQRLKTCFADMLIPQDRQPFRPHITIQNKVAPDVARKLCNDLTASFEPFAVQATGLQLWRYMGGPWELIHVFAHLP